MAVFAGESVPAALRETARRVCTARGVALEDCQVRWSSDLPRLSLPSHRKALGRHLREHDIEVAFLDPLYLCLLAGVRPASASNLYEVGPLLWSAARTCLDAGATPILVHHSNKSASRKSLDAGEPPDLDDLAFSGIGEFARQWVLLGRREPFRPDVGRHQLVMAAGGSAGHSGVWEVTVDEGVMRDDFGGRKWKVEVNVANPAVRPDAESGGGPARRKKG